MRSQAVEHLCSVICCFPSKQLSKFLSLEALTLTAGLQDIVAKLEDMPRKKKDRTALGLGLYALSSCFLATMLMFAKKLGEHI